MPIDLGKLSNWAGGVGRDFDKNVLQSPTAAMAVGLIPGIGLPLAGGMAAYQLLRKKGDDNSAAPAQPDVNSAGTPSPEEQSASNIQNELKAFAEQYNKPLDINDPYAKSIMDMASSATQKQLAAQGITGTGSLAAQQRSMQDAALQYQQQNRQLAVQGLSEAGKQSLGLGQLAQVRREDVYGSQMNQYAQGQQQAAAKAGLVGSIGGGIVDAATLAATNGAVNPHASQLAGGIASSIGSTNYGSKNPYPTYQGGGGA